MVEFKDLTLREGSQVPGLEITESAGKAVLEHLADLNIGRVEVSFPRAHPRESWFHHADDLGMRTAALARSVSNDVDAALEVNPDEIEVIVTSSDIQLKHALGKRREEAQNLLVSNVERVLAGGADAGVTLMDAIRAENDFLVETARVAVDTGAKHITLADTTGAGMPETVGETVTAVVDEIKNEADIAVHTHDDMGVATAGAVAGVTAGATAVDATVGGIGERAGNVPLEEVAVLLTEQDNELDIDLKKLVPITCRVHETLGVDIPEGKPIIGERAYRHESGMHTAAMLEEPSTYEPFDPAKYGGERTLLFGGDSGRGAVRALLADIDVEPTSRVVSESLAALEDAAAKKGEPLYKEKAREIIQKR